MDQSEYRAFRAASSDLFNNGLLLPVARAILRLTGGTISASEIRRELGGRAESNQIRDALRRLELVEAVRELPYPGRPSPRLWTREDHPIWAFVEAWTPALPAAKKP